MVKPLTGLSLTLSKSLTRASHNSLVQGSCLQRLAFSPPSHPAAAPFALLSLLHESFIHTLPVIIIPFLHYNSNAGFSPLNRVGLDKDCVPAFEDLKLGRDKSLKYIIFKLSDDKKFIVVEKKGSDLDYDSFLGDLPEKDCRYAVYDFEYELLTGEGKRFVFYSYPRQPKPRKQGERKRQTQRRGNAEGMEADICFQPYRQKLCFYTWSPDDAPVRVRIPSPSSPQQDAPSRKLRFPSLFLLPLYLISLTTGTRLTESNYSQRWFTPHPRMPYVAPWTASTPTCKVPTLARSPTRPSSRRFPRDRAPSKDGVSLLIFFEPFTTYPQFNTTGVNSSSVYMLRPSFLLPIFSFVPLSSEFHASFINQ